MEIKIDIITQFILNSIKDFITENEIIPKTEINRETRLIGMDALFDSLNLVSFIVDLEEKLEVEFGVDVQLMDEKAMSNKTSPFININRFAKFIKDQLDEK